MVKVKVVEIDEKRKRIALTMRLMDAPSQPVQRENKPEQRTVGEMIHRGLSSNNKNGNLSVAAQWQRLLRD